MVSKLSINISNSSVLWLVNPVQWYYIPFFIVNTYFQNKEFLQPPYRQRFPDVCTYSASLNVIRMVISSKLLTFDN